jgi:hypothetical protein
VDFHIPTHTYTYLHIPTHTYTYLHIPTHTYTEAEVWVVVTRAGPRQAAEIQTEAEV